MWVQKYDYSALKMEFFQSDHDELKAFLSEKWVNYTSWGIAKQTTGWTKEKQERKAQIVEKALKKKQEELAQKLQIPMEQLFESKKATILLTRKKLKYFAELDKESIGDIDIGDIEKIYKIIKTELWEPTKITTNTNINHNEELSDEDKELISNYIKQKHGTGWDDNK